VLSEFADFQYKCTGRYRPETERTLQWDCATLGVEWPLDGNTPVLSTKDREGGLGLGECELFE
jgi:dTDP-4-dehydrorhamnose 3,5-epimerase